MVQSARAFIEPAAITDVVDLIIVTVNNQRRHIKLLQVFAEIRLGEGLDAVEGVFGAGLHSLEPERIDYAL